MAAKTNTTQINEDWQLNKSLTECNRYMLENGIATDITFLVSDGNADSESQTFSTHKNMLISRSPVFFTMLCGLLPEKGNIEVTDVHPEAFRQMLNYIYTDDLQLSMDLVPHVINLSTKYLLPGLTTKCAAFIKDHLDADNVCTILDQILIFEQNDLNQLCLNFIMRETHKVLQSKVFMSIRRETLSKILDINTSEVKEADMFEVCLKWAEQKCVHQEKETTGINIREMLGDCITKFRFSDIKCFAIEVCPTGVFTKFEESGILQHLVDKQAIPAPTGFNCKARLRPIYRIHTTEEIQQVLCEKLDFRITFNSNNAIKVNAIFIGKVDRLSNLSIKYNDANIGVALTNARDEKKLELKCESEFVVRPGPSNLQLTYFIKGGLVSGSNTAGNYIYGVPRR